MRLGLCNLDCGSGAGAKWQCDTPYTWDWSGKLGVRQDRSKLRHLSPREVADTVGAMFVPLAVITGGEPLLQQRALVPLIGMLAEQGTAVEIETNGTVAPSAELAATAARFNVSPKLSDSGVDHAKAINVDALDALADTGRAAFKFVCADAADVAEIDHVVHVASLLASDVWVMPAGRQWSEVEQSLASIADDAIACGYNVTTRLHIAVWGNTPGH